MSAGDVNSKSLIIGRRLLDEVDWSDLQKIHLYTALAELKEVNTTGLVNELRSRWPHLQITLAEQRPTQELPPDKFDLIIVPTLAFDKEGYRLGWGSGWYDKFLAAQPQALKIGLCFANGFIENLPHEPHDISLDKVITEL